MSCVWETHSDAQSFEDVHFTHGTRAMVQQPRIYAAFMEQMSANVKDNKPFGVGQFKE